MRLLNLTLLFVLFSVSAAEAQTVISDTNLSLLSPNNSTPGANFSVLVWQNAAATNPTTVWLKYDGTHVSFGNINLDEGSDWYLVHPGDHFDKATIQSNAFPAIVTFIVFNLPAVTVGSGDFYLGVNTGLGFEPDLFHRQRTVFGWVHLQPVSPGSTTLVMLGNVMSYDSPGIIVGTTTLVPEPGAAALFAVGLIGMIVRRHRPCCSRSPGGWVDWPRH